jgi:hypothetical protein
MESLERAVVHWGREKLCCLWRNTCSSNVNPGDSLEIHSPTSSLLIRCAHVFYLAKRPTPLLLQLTSSAGQRRIKNDFGGKNRESPAHIRED